MLGLKILQTRNMILLKKDYPENIEELKKILNKSYPELQKHIMNDVLRFAINMEYSSINQKLYPDDEIAIFPPVSGG